MHKKDAERAVLVLCDLDTQGASREVEEARAADVDVVDALWVLASLALCSRRMEKSAREEGEGAGGGRGGGGHQVALQLRRNVGAGQNEARERVEMNVFPTEAHNGARVARSQLVATQHTQDRSALVPKLATLA